VSTREKYGWGGDGPVPALQQPFYFIAQLKISMVIRTKIGFLDLIQSGETNDKTRKPSDELDKKRFDAAVILTSSSRGARTASISVFVARQRLYNLLHLSNIKSKQKRVTDINVSSEHLVESKNQF